MKNFFLSLIVRYYVYILANKYKTVFYIGVTNNLFRRINEHVTDAVTLKKSFTGKYNCVHLLYQEEFQNVQHAISREKELKGWRREKKLALIKTVNPELNFIEI